MVFAPALPAPAGNAGELRGIRRAGSPWQAGSVVVQHWCDGVDAHIRLVGYAVVWYPARGRSPLNKMPVLFGLEPVQSNTKWG